MATQVTTTRQVFDHHLGALLAGDIEEILADYTEESVILHADGAVKGRQAIQKFFDGFLSTLLKPGTYQLSADGVHVDGDALFAIWHANCAGADIVFAADTFVMKNGKIAIQTVAAKIEPHS